MRTLRHANGSPAERERALASHRQRQPRRESESFVFASLAAAPQRAREVERVTDSEPRQVQPDKSGRERESFVLPTATWHRDPDITGEQSGD